ncbi:MAG TPA: mechanosensitive ion channel family protein [Terriglobales bacterium]|nr:mechanosensitive ion channel family protein [Terriglobales bacterium]
MKKRILSLCFTLITCLLLQAVHTLPMVAQQPSPQPTAPNQSAGSRQESVKEEIEQPGQVEVEGRAILTIYEPIGTLTPEERAAAIARRIIFLAGGSASPDSIRLQPRDAWTEIILDNMVIMAVTDADAKAAGKKREQLAFEDEEAIRQAILNYRREHSWRLLMRGILYAAIASVILFLLLWLLRRIRFALRDRVQRRIQASAQVEKKSAWHVSIAYLGPMALALGAFVRWVLILGFIEIYLTVTLGFFSPTREISHTVTGWLLSQLGTMGRAAVDYLPNLLVIAVITLITSYAIRLIRLFFGQIQKGDVKIHGFYPDWAEPTDKLVRLLVLVLALIVAFPYLPGAKSPAFQGISIFLGVLLSLGSSSAVANAIAGIILTYMRSFLAGDWVQIGDTTGEVVEKTLLVTRILTPKAEIITIPNATVMSGSVKNFSVQAKKTGVIFYTTVTIGYDAPWRTVHQLLVSSALATKHVLPQPAPFVLQDRLHDFYVGYELNAYTDAPREMLNIFSELHQNIQDKFNEAGVEICSPHFSSMRDGNTIAIPEQYIPADYKGPGFRLKLVEIDAKNGAALNQIRNSQQTR